jgi:hypothetical protein
MVACKRPVKGLAMHVLYVRNGKVVRVVKKFLGKTRQIFKFKNVKTLINA